MELTVLAVPGCPDAPELERRLATVLADRPAATIRDASRSSRATAGAATASIPVPA